MNTKDNGMRNLSIADFGMRISEWEMRNAEVGMGNAEWPEVGIGKAERGRRNLSIPDFGMRNAEVGMGKLESAYFGLKRRGKETEFIAND
jgi:hypothetical protein